MAMEIGRGDFSKLVAPAEGTIAINDVKHLSSYNWIDGLTPTIAVPGSPNRWSPSYTEVTLPQDTGEYYMSQNAARSPDSPLEPIFRALSRTAPSFDVASVDIVTDRSNIRKLLAFINPQLAKQETKRWMMAVEVVQNTALFCPQETKTSITINPGQDNGYGREFEKAFTTRKIDGSASHHRIVTYSFGGMKLMVRHETDGYLSLNDQIKSRYGNHLASIDSMISSALQWQDRKPTTPPQELNESKLQIRHEGKEIGIESTIEIKTKSHNNKVVVKDFAAQLWASQTPKLVRAYYHPGGKFPTPNVEDVSDEIKEWEAKNRADLSILAALLRRILTLAKQFGGAVTVSYDPKRERLTVFKDKPDKKMLPDDLYRMWQEQPADNAEDAWEIVEGDDDDVL
jgi:hypothetical protein